jgi:hypothetical protein
LIFLGATIESIDVRADVFGPQADYGVAKPERTIFLANLLA